MQQGVYSVRAGAELSRCHANCAGMQSWLLNPPQLSRPAPNGEVWATYSTVGGLVYRHVLVPLLRAGYTLSAWPRRPCRPLFLRIASPLGAGGSHGRCGLSVPPSRRDLF